jgi:1,4-alpha-glucan branching enzyme
MNSPVAALIREDPYLAPYRQALEARHERIQDVQRRLMGRRRSLRRFACGYTHFGLHRTAEGWVLREWAPAATAIGLIGDVTHWREREAFRLRRVNDEGDWELRLPPDALRHGDLYRLRVHWPGGAGDRIPSYANRVVQDATTHIFNAQVWHPPQPWRWRHASPPAPAAPLIYESHVGMAQEREGVGTYDEFRELILPRIVRAGYNTVQLMAVLEHPYYASFGYHVSSYFAPSSRFGTPDEFRALVDGAHGLGLRVIMDLVHSHAVSNEVEGLSCFDGTPYQYFHEGPRGRHEAWGSRCFDYAKPHVLHFLLSNCRYWLEEFHVDGFRFDGVTSMLYHSHGLGQAFGHYADYFGDGVDADALAYLALANRLIHECRPDAVSIAEDVSGMPALAAPPEQGGCGFDFRLAMGVPDCWFKLAEDTPDEQWNMGGLWHELNNRRVEERTIAYVESHDQALVGGKTMMFSLADEAMYRFMRVSDANLQVERAMALHKAMRLATLATAAGGYLNFMGNEFGHPEWIDFPREGNGWSYKHARRQWSLRYDEGLKFRLLADFDAALLRLARETGLAAAKAPRLLLLHEEDKTLAFERAGHLFLLNFHPTRSLGDYAIPAPPGRYRLVLDTDESRFGGHGRLAAGQEHFTRPASGSAASPHAISVYLPCRVGLVLRRMD